MGADAAAEEQFGPYVVYERLGVGGMATVHRALERDGTGRERIVALKRLLPHLAEDASFIKAFVREAKLASLLAHINIVEIYELGRVGSEYFISMEYIDGQDVRRVLRHARKVTGPPPIDITVGLMLQLCDALDYAHTRVDDDGHPLGLVHRDVSPSNLIVTTSGHLKVIDFGIAKAQSSQLRTQTGRVKGKLAYMAPEAISGSRDLDARSDIWAAGVILHELLTARPLFASKNEYQTLLKVQRGEITPASTFNQATPPELDAIVFKALERDPDDRFGGAHALREELDEVRRHYQLKSTARDVAAWIDWAFSLETPDGFLNEASQLSPGRAPTPLPVRTRDDDEAVELVWGSGDAESNGAVGPLLLDDVPDVSEKHLAQPDPFRVDDEDDIPTPRPTHGEPAPLHLTDEPITDPEGVRVTTDPVSRPSEDALFDDGDETIDMSHPEAPPPPVAPTRVRFTKPPPVAMATPAVPAGGVVPLRPPPQTKPGVHPASAHVRAPTPKPSAPMIGAALVARNKPSRRRVWLVAGLVVLGAGATAATLVLTTGVDTVATRSAREPTPSAHEPGMLKFVIEPADAEITIASPGFAGARSAAEGRRGESIASQVHAGSPWSTPMPAGQYQIEIRRAGYKARVMSIELAPKETHTFEVMLEHLGGAANGDATLSVSTTPPGLEVVVDGTLLAKHTPIKGEALKPGPHAIEIRRDGVSIWHQRITAEPSSDYELNPSFVAPAPTPTKATANPPPDAATDTRDAPVVPTGTPAVVPPLPPLPAVGPVDAAVPVAADPQTVVPTAVTKVSGDPPSFAKLDVTQLPAIIPAKLCIDTSGVVASVDILVKIDHDVAETVRSTLQTWRYAPFKKAGVAVAACFAVTLRAK